MAITAHWINFEWKICNIMLDFIHITGPHSGENLSHAFVQSLNSFGILHKVIKNLLTSMNFY